jgi:hypothetical protein
MSSEPSNAEYAAALRSAGGGREFVTPAVTATDMWQGFKVGLNFVTLVGLGFLVLLVFIVIFLVTREGGPRAGFAMPGDNCTVITCPAGVMGPPGVQGPIGVSQNLFFRIIFLKRVLFFFHSQ